MFAQIAGGIAVFLGVLWIIWPQILRGWLVRKTSGTIFWALFFSFFFPFAAWVKQLGGQGWIAALIAFFALGSLLRALIGKTAEKIPLLYYRLAGAANTASGIYMLVYGPGP